MAEGSRDCHKAAWTWGNHKLGSKFLGEMQGWPHLLWDVWGLGLVCEDVAMSSTEALLSPIFFLLVVWTGLCINYVSGKVVTIWATFQAASWAFLLKYPFNPSTLWGLPPPPGSFLPSLKSSLSTSWPLSTLLPLPKWCLSYPRLHPVTASHYH